jgi:hypothetical protein
LDPVTGDHDRGIFYWPCSGPVNESATGEHDSRCRNLILADFFIRWGGTTTEKQKAQQ